MGACFGGKLLAWIDEQAALFTAMLVENRNIASKYISGINFRNAVKQGGIIEIVPEVVNFGHTALVLQCEVINRRTKTTILTVDNSVMVNLVMVGQRPVANGWR